MDNPEANQTQLEQFSLEEAMEDDQISEVVRLAGDMIPDKYES